MKLILEAFRGASRPFSVVFDTKQSLSVLYGENGSGKTTVSDAFEFVIDGTSGSLEGKSLDGKSRLGQLVNARRGKAELSVSLTVQQKTRSAGISGGGVVHVGTLEHQVKVLSRKNITRLIEETPANRFKKIQDFVSIPVLDREEVALNSLILSEKKNLESQSRVITQAQQGLADLFNRHADNSKFGDRQVDWQEDVLNESEESIAENLRLLQALNQEVVRLREDFSPLAESFASVNLARGTVEKETTALSQLVASQGGELAQALETLQQAQLYLKMSKVDNCPVCDTEVGYNTLVSKVDENLEALDAVRSQSKKVKEAKDLLQNALTALRTLQTAFFSTISRLKQAHEAASETNQWELVALVPTIVSIQSVDELSNTWFDRLKIEAPQLKPLSSTVENELAAIQIRSNVQKDVQQAVKQINDATREGSRIEFVVTRGEAIKKVLHDERIRHANETLGAISGDFADLYQTIHPGEEIEAIKLYLHPTKKASAQFDGSLFGKDGASPVAYLSESHLDTLGLCLFLALEKQGDPGKTILFLDDAIASVDEAHMERLYQLLLDQASHFHHVIIGSHYQPLRFKFRWGILTRKKVEFLELSSWSLEQGLSLSKGPDSEVKFLRRYMSDGEHASAIASTSGVVLEYIFDFLTGIYQCKLPRNPGADQRWTLDNYRGGLKGEKQLLGALRCEHLDEAGIVTESIDLEPLIEGIFSYLQVRNVIGCHYKELAGHFNELGEALALGDATLKLVTAICDEDDTLPDRRRDGCSWHNRGKAITRRLYPLLKPE